MKLSVSAPIAISKTHFRSRELPNFSVIHHAAKPFFKQWCIAAVDVTRILSVPYTEARHIMSALRSFYGKTKSESIMVEEFCAFTGVGKGIVRMHLVSRILEGELRKQVGRERQWAIGNRQ